MPESLGEWLAHLEQLHPSTIELGLARVATVKERLQFRPDFPILTVAGTNGKGSTCAMLEAILGAAGYRVGCYTSPHLLRYNERVRVAGYEVDDAALCRAFAAVEAARGDVSLTYFEFGTLAAMWLFVQQQVEVAILEVGLGGRLDAVNVFDADCSVVTSVDIDHTDYLGDDRESIGREKAGIFRATRPAICADHNPPHSLLQHAEGIGAELKLINRDFGAESQEGQWLFWSQAGWRMTLPYPSLRGAYQLDNASACLAALEALKEKLPVTPENIRRGLLEASVPGRFQVLPGKPALILDVAHNPHAARALASNLHQMWCGGRTIAVFAMLSDKDVAGVIAALREEVDLWLIAGIVHARGASAVELQARLSDVGIQAIQAFPDIAAAYHHACQIAGEDDRIAVFGSFHTVAEVMQSARNRKPD
ncbi:bifunctional folylpolyglutamate synthase/dihydrofolate synthase [Sulfurimicrobium lacus]|uniref:Dihydrofolate synthase/folylpolyglutamate synthase n=1 Tax=Sulfurimicrobium lacus TaxID=2715678 RepID=A0A6F8VCE1_9PROT|nr:bifunctional tetrahydrofolate synthase/dihydrofolate synthase [Sulfurimicrobium lacus]BCB26425.1 bifunctional folylpolyglutamate synthase/dihydrofolate synthase [Sulfurimicrobium lacus]